MKILVTGGAGFIGSHLTQALVEKGDQVRVLDDFSTGRRRNLKDLLGRIELIEGDVRDEAVVARAVKGSEIVFHQAALPSVPRSFADPAGTTAVNVGGTINLLECARKSGVKRFIFASSSSVYGEADGPIKQESVPPQPLSPYAVSKLAGEMYCRLYARIHNLPTLSLRYFNIFGPRQDPRSQYAAVIPRFITAVLRGRSPIIYGDGSQTRDFTYVGNAVAANLQALSASPPTWGEVFNIACGEKNDLLTLVEMIEKLAGRRANARFAPPRPGDIKHSRADIARSREQLGYEPKVLFAEGLEKTFHYYKLALAR